MIFSTECRYFRRSTGRRVRAPVPLLEGISECRLLSHRLGAGVGRVVADLLVLGSKRNQSPTELHRFLLSIRIKADGQDVLRSCDVVTQP